MNPAHIHLMLNHIPILGVPIAAAFLAHSIAKGNESNRNFALFVLTLVSFAIIPVYFSGEPAEGVIEHLPGVMEDFIAAHEDSALLSLIVTRVAGLSAFMALALGQKNEKGQLAEIIALAAAVLATLSLGYTGYLGGKVRHTEVRDSGTISRNSK